MTRRLTRPLLLAACLSAASCSSVADVLSGDEILEEIDEIVLLEGSGQDLSIVFRTEEVKLSAWYMRQVLLAPIRGGLAFVFGRHQISELKNPGAHIRELLRELPYETGSGLRLCAAATSRYGWLAELAPNAETRILSIDGLAAVCEELGIEPFAGDLNEFGRPAPAAECDAARDSLRALRPTQRGDAPLSDVALVPYRTALRTITERPLADWAARLALVEDLAGLLARERDERCVPWTEDALRRAIAHCVAGILVHTIEGRDIGFAEVRLCAMEQIRRLGGPRTVPMMLAAMTASPAQRQAGEPQFDPDELVRLRLIHYCGQLDEQNANTLVRLPGRSDWEASTAVEFLARTVLSERNYYSRLRTPALVALTWCLQRERVDPDPAWVRDWIETRGS